MKKLFLIPLMAMLCTVMAWADPVTTLEDLQAALNAGGEVTLGASINLGKSSVTLASGTATLNLGEFTLSSGNTGQKTSGVIKVTGGNLTINATTGGVRNTSANTQGNAVLLTGGSLTINGGAFHGTYEAIYASAGSINITGGSFETTYDNDIWMAGEVITNISGGAFTGGWMCFQVDHGTLNISGGSFTKGDGTIYPGGTINITGGTFDENPWKYVSDPYYVGKADALYQVAHIGSNVAVADYVAYPSLAEAVAGASDGALISLFANDNNSVSVSKNAVIETNGYTASGVSAGAGYTKCVVDESIIITNNPLITFLQGAESAKILDANISFAQKIVVNGTKELTIPAGITVSATYVKDACIVVPNGAKLTIYGDGTIAGDKELIRVLEGGELIIGKADQSDCLKMTTTVWEGVNYAVNNYGKTTINNAEVHAASAALNTYGVMNVNGGYYTAEAYYPNHRYAVTADDGSQLTIKNSRVYGIHGALACQGSAGSNIGGSARIENCELVATNKPYLTTKSTTSIHYGIYSASGGIVSVYNTKMRSTQQDRAIHIGNNDAWNTFGLVHVYEGCMVKAVSGKKIYVQKRTATDKEVLFPVSVDASSDWYKAAMNGGEAPLPAGYKWKAIVASGEDNDDQVVNAEAYAEGYRWITVGTATETQEADDDPTATIPWQQSSTWDATAESSSTADVPEATTAVTIPEGKTVVISKDPEKNNNITKAVAEQVVLGGEGASLTVEEGTSLNVTNGVNIADGAKLVVNAGAMVTIGEGGVVAGNDEAVEVKMTEGKTGTFMIAPTVKENTHPMAKVELVSKAYKKGDGTYVWQRFGIPAYMTGVTRGSVLYDHEAAPTAWKKLDYANQTWANMLADDEFIPFQCYELTTQATEAGATYTFTCPLMGNGNAELVLQDKWNYYANSYTAPIDIASLLTSFEDNYNHMSATIYLYNPEDDWWTEINQYTYLFEPTTPTQIDPMQAFIFNRISAGVNPEVNYEENVWNPIVNPTPAPARARQSFNKAQIEIVAEDGAKDLIRLIEGVQFSSEFDNGADAEKYENPNSFNLFVENANAHWGTIASDNLDGTIISMSSKEQTTFTLTISNVTGMDYVVRDMFTGTEIAMTEGATYMFSVPADSEISGRFNIVKVNKVPTGISNTTATSTNKGIYSVTGQFVGTDYHALPAGVYVVDGKKVIK